jgi:hypothetical protein
MITPPMVPCRRSGPIFALKPAHRWRRRVLDLEPMRRSTGLVRRAEPFRNDALAAQRAGVLVDRGGIAAVNLVDRDAVVPMLNEPRKVFFPLFDRIRPQVSAVDLDEVEGAECRYAVVASISKQVEDGQSFLIHHDSLTVDDAGFDGQATKGINDYRIAASEIVAAPRNETDISPLPMREDPEAIVFYFVNPARTRRRCIGRVRQAWFEPGKRLLGAHPVPQFTH